MCLHIKRIEYNFRAQNVFGNCIQLPKLECGTRESSRLFFLSFNFFSDRYTWNLFDSPLRTIGSIQNRRYRRYDP